MFHHSTTIHPRFRPQGPSPLWSGDDNVPSIKPEKEVEETLLDYQNNGESETMEEPEVDQVNPTQPKEEEEGEGGVHSFSVDEIRSPTVVSESEISNTNIFENGVVPEEESTPPMPPPPGQGQGQGQPRFQLQTRIQLPNKEFCLNRGLPHLNLIMEFEDDVQILKIDLHKYLKSLESEESLPQPPLETASVQETKDDIVDISSTPSSPPPLIPPTPSSNSNGNEIQLPILTEVSPKNNQEVTPTRVKVNPSVGGPHRSTKDTINDKAGWRYSCYFCLRRFRTTYQLNLHLLVHTTEMPYPCDKCGKQFNRKASFDRHQRLHAVIIRRPFSCDECGQTYLEKYHLTNHKKLFHRGEKEIQCPECDRKFGTKQHMREHLESHFRIRIPCPQPNCGKIFLKKSTLQKHQKKVHPNK